MLYALLFMMVGAPVSLNDCQWAAREAEIACIQEGIQSFERAHKNLGDMGLQVAWTQSAWCDALAEQVEFLLTTAHAPTLAVRMSSSLEQCSGFSQQLFRQTLAAERAFAANILHENEDEDEDELFLQDAFSYQRSYEAREFLEKARMKKNSACVELASQLINPARNVAHERLFLALLACRRKAEV